MFLLLGPAGKAPQYHEIGRSIATLMTDEVIKIPREVDTDYEVYHIIKFLRSGISNPFQADTDCETYIL